MKFKSRSPPPIFLLGPVAQLDSASAFYASETAGGRGFESRRARQKGVAMRAIDIGERGIIELIARELEKDVEELLGIGDDVSAKLIGDSCVVFHTDCVTVESDLLPGMSYDQLGKKLVVANISDLAAKGAKPVGMLVSWGIPPDTETVVISEVARGINSATKEYGIRVLGGDTEFSNTFFLAGFCIGTIDRKCIVPRSGAKPGDIVATTGYFGHTALAFLALLNGYQIPEDVLEEVKKLVYAPQARLREGIAIAESGAASASIDCSDGLAWSLHEIARRSGVAIKITALPTHPIVEKLPKREELDVRNLVLYGGDEYELVYAIKEDRWEDALKAVESVGGSLVKIGCVESGEGVWLELEGSPPTPIEPIGWEHLTKRFKPLGRF